MEKEEFILKAIEAYNDALKDPESSWRHRLESQNGCRVKEEKLTAKTQVCSCHSKSSLEGAEMHRSYSSNINYDAELQSSLFESKSTAQLVKF